MPIHTTTHWKRFTLIGMLVGLLGSALLPASTTTGYAAQTTTGNSFEWSTPDGAGGSASFDNPGVYAEVDTANPRYDGLCSNRAYHISSTVTVISVGKHSSTVVDVTGGLIQPVGDGSYETYPGPYYGPITSQGARILNDNSWHWWEQIILFPFTVSTDANASARVELYVDLHGGPAQYADKPYGWSEMYEKFSTVQVDYELIPVEVNAEGKVIGELPPEDATNNCGTYYEVSFYPNPLGPDTLPDTGDEPIETFGPDGLPGTDDDLPIGGGITDDPGSLRQTSGGGPGDKEEKPERCATHTHRIPADFSAAGVNIQYGWFRVERRVCFDNIRVTRITHSKVFLDMDDPVRALNMLSHHQIEFDGAPEPWEGHPQGAMNTFWEFSIRLDTPEIRVPGFTIPFTERQVGSFTLPAYTGEIEKPAIRIISLANGCYFATPGGGDDPICPPGSYK